MLSTAVMFGYFAGTLFIFLVNLRWKISIHTMGIAGPTTVLVYVFGYWGALLGLLLPPVIWSRVYLKKHTLAQALAGAFVGFLLTAFALWLVLSFGLPYAPPRRATRFETLREENSRPSRRNQWSRAPAARST